MAFEIAESRAARQPHVIYPKRDPSLHMNARKPSLVLWLLCAPVLLGEAPVQLSLELPPPESPTKPPIVHHVFGDQTVQTRCVIDSPMVGGTASLDARLIQLTSGIAAPLGATQELLHESPFETRRPLAVGIPFPATDRPTPIKVHLGLRLQGEPDTITKTDVLFVVYPNDTLKVFREQVVQWTDQESRQLIVVGAGQKLRSFLKTNNIPFEEGGESLPDNPNPKHIYLCDRESPKSLTLLPSIHIIDFRPPSNRLPGVYRETKDGGTLTEITLPVLENLTTGPREQTLLSELIQQTLSQKPISK